MMLQAGGYLLVLALMLPVVGILLLMALDARHAGRIALGLMPVGLAISLAIAARVWTTGAGLEYFIGGWAPPLGVALRADGISAVMLVTTAVVIGAAGLLLSVLHGTESAIWAAAYFRVGALDSPMRAMLYSIDSMTTRGGAELTLPPHWQMMGALEAADGMILFETPNPENLMVGACNFYLDPTHRNPIPPGAAQFMAMQRGFARADILRLHPYDVSSHIKEKGETQDLLNYLLYGPQDYAIAAWKQAAGAPAS